jgi:polysaccharide biosynthesis/export protein
LIRPVIRSLTFILLAFAMLAIPAVAARCSGTLPPTAAQSPPDSTALDWSSVPEYRIVPGDGLTLDFGPRADLNGDILREVIVRPDGRITVFPVGDVVAAGLTSRELETELVKLLSGDIRAPRVTVEITKLAANVVHVLGEVEHPGSYPADSYMTVVQAITAAGGFSENAAKNDVLVFNRNGANTVKVAMVHVDELLNSKGLQGDLRLSRFDIVYVPRSAIGNIDVYSRRLFGSLTNATNLALSGWELFNLDRVYAFPVHR